MMCKAILNQTTNKHLKNNPQKQQCSMKGGGEGEKKGHNEVGICSGAISPPAEKKKKKRMAGVGDMSAISAEARPTEHAHTGGP